MRRFHCQSCDTEVYFLNTTCVTCKRQLGYLPETFEMTALEPQGEALSALVVPARNVRHCQNAHYEACNWLMPADCAHAYCIACRHNRTIPDLSMDSNLSNWRQIEQAKHQLFYSLMRWRLPIAIPTYERSGLAFDFLADWIDGDGKTMLALTGHDGGVITINVAEGDDAVREQRRLAMREPYRTLLGHFRHEIGHFYWDVLVRGGKRIDRFRELFGDETTDYPSALQHHYEQGPPEGWKDAFISSYATTHPWEDFAETWAHYTHIVDSLETAQAYGMTVSAGGVGPVRETAVQFRPYAADGATDIIDAWIPFTVALNSINRSMGQRDFYPFVLSPPVMAKLQFVHEIIHGK